MGNGAYSRQGSLGPFSFSAGECSGQLRECGVPDEKMRSLTAYLQIERMKFPAERESRSSCGLKLSIVNVCYSKEASKD